MHFFNPVPVMKPGRSHPRPRNLRSHLRDRAATLSTAIAKIPVEVNDAAGFVSNRVLMPLINEACFAVMEGVATPEAIDTIFREGMAHPMGPLTLADFIGLDVCVDIMRVLVEGLGDPKYRPCPLLIRMVDPPAGWAANPAVASTPTPPHRPGPDNRELRSPPHTDPTGTSTCLPAKMVVRICRMPQDLYFEDFYIGQTLPVRRLHTGHRRGDQGLRPEVRPAALPPRRSRR